MSKDSMSLSLQAPPAAGQPQLRQKVPLSQPLRHRALPPPLVANLVSNLGTWIQTFASAWLVASSPTRPPARPWCKRPATCPIFLFALFAGVVADAVHRPKFLFYCNLFMAACACTMAALVLTGHHAPHGAGAGPDLLPGRGSAFMWPAWQAAMSGLVEPDEVEAAATLNNLSLQRRRHPRAGAGRRAVQLDRAGPAVPAQRPVLHRPADGVPGLVATQARRPPAHFRGPSARACARACAGLRLSALPPHPGQRAAPCSSPPSPSPACCRCSCATCCT